MTVETHLGFCQGKFELSPVDDDYIRIMGIIDAPNDRLNVLQCEIVHVIFPPAGYRP